MPHHPQCKKRTLLGSDGARITDPAAFLSKAGQVCALFAEHELVGASTATLRQCDRLLRAIEMSFIREDDRSIEPLAPGPEGGVTIKRFGLCGDHARQLARGYVVASHYRAAYPDCPAPPPELVWSVGSVAVYNADWMLPALVLLVRSWSFGVWTPREVDRAVEGVRRWKQDDYSYLADLDGGDQLGLEIGLYLLSDGEKQETEEAEAKAMARPFFFKPMRALLCRYDKADEDFADLVLETFTRLAPPRFERSPSPTSMTAPGGKPNWFRVGF